MEDYDTAMEAFFKQEEWLKEISIFMEIFRERDEQLENESDSCIQNLTSQKIMKKKYWML